MRTANAAIGRSKENYYKKPESMKQSRFIRALSVLFLSLCFLQVGSAQTIDTVTCICSDDGPKVQDSIIINSMPGETWYIFDYSGQTLIPDSTLWHAADEDISEGYYLAPDAAYQPLDTLEVDPSNTSRYYLVTYRQLDVAFSGIAITNGTDTLITSYPVCTPPGSSEGVVGTMLMQDTLCLGMGDTYSLTGILAADLDSANWVLTHALTNSGSSFTGFSNAFTFTEPGTYTLNISGVTTKGCDFMISDSIYVIDTDFPMSGPSFACANGDTTLFTIPQEALAIYDSIYWEIDGTATGSFVPAGDSINTDSVMIAWDTIMTASETAWVKVFGFDRETQAMCEFADSILVTVTGTLGASVMGDSLFCLNETGAFTAFVNNLDSIVWRNTNPLNVIITDTTLSEIMVAFDGVGLDTFTIEGVTMMGCPVIDTFIVDVKDSQVLLSGDINVCLGETIGYRAMYTDASLAEFSTITWEVTPMLGTMDTTLFKTSPTGPYDSLLVDWTMVGDFQIIVNGMTMDQCMLSDTIDVSVQDTVIKILGPEFACFSDDGIMNLSQYVLVQAADSMDVISGDSVSWKIMRGSMPDGFTEIANCTNCTDTLDHGFFLGTYSDPNVMYLVIAEGVTSNGCAFLDTMIVDVLGRNDLRINGATELCSGTRDEVYYVNIPDSLFSTPAVWDVRYNNGTQLSPSFWVGDGDSLVIDFPNIQDTFNITLSTTIEGSQCDPTISSLQVIISDTINFVDQSNQRYLTTPAFDTLCLSQDSVIFALNVDSIDIDDINNFSFTLFNNATNALIMELPKTSSGSQIATYVQWPSFGEYSIRATGYTVDDCEINEELIITVKDTNYVISGDNQICIGDTMTYAFLQGWDMATVDSLNGMDSVRWYSYLTESGSGTKMAIAAPFGPHFDSIRTVFDTPGAYTILAEAITDCDCEVDAVLEVIVRGAIFQMIGDTEVCDASQAIYYIANDDADSTRINDLVSDSTVWSLASGITTQFSGALDADSIIINWNRQGEFTEVYDTIYFQGITDDGCAVYDTLPIVIHTNDYVVLGSEEVCADESIEIVLRNAFDSTAIFGLDSVTWVVNGTDTIQTPSIDTLDRLDMAGTITTWPTGGTYVIEAFGTTTTGCIVNETFTVTVYDPLDVNILGDQNTCYQLAGRPQRPLSPDVYRLNVPTSSIIDVDWTIEALGAFPQPVFSGAMTPILSVTEWTSSGYPDSQADYRIIVNGTSTGGCTFADSILITIIPTEDAFTLICNNSLNITLPNSCELELTPDMILENWEALSATVPAEEFEIRVKDPETGVMLSDEGIVDASLLGKRIQVEVEHECSGQVCWGYVTLEDKNIPQLICGRDTLDCDDNILPNALDFGTGRVLGYPVPSVSDGDNVTVTSNGANTFIVRNFEKCGDATLTYSDRINEEICTGDFGTIIYRDWSMTNLSGITSTCTDTLLIRRLNIDSFLTMFEDQLEDKTFECGESVDDFANPTFNLDRFCFNIQWTSSEMTDLLCGDNPNTYTTTKTWTILDWCTGVVKVVDQTIRVSDNTPPTINLRSNVITTQADDDFCFGILELTTNDISIADPSLCSDIKSTRVRVFEDEIPGLLIAEETYDGNFTELIISDPNILLDLSKIVIAVETMDDCGNMSADTISRMVMVDDQIVPNAVCDEIVVVGLNDEGWGFGSYQAFDRGSNDNCGPVEICITRVDDEDIFKSLDTDRNNLVDYAAFVTALENVGRSGTSYKTTTIGSNVLLHIDSLCTNKLKFECADAMDSFLGNDVEVRMTVTDINGRSSTCTTDVEVRDNGIIDTIIVVQGDQFLECGADYSQYIPFDGAATVRFLTNCGIPLVPMYSIDTSGLNNCGLGQIIRRYTATDRDGNVFSHEQIIQVGDPSDIVNPDNIPGFWPADYIGEGCPGSSFELPEAFTPNFNPADFPCSQADLIFSDLVFYNVEGYCAKVLRTWTLIDWCQMNNNDPDAGSWEYVQILKLTDTVDPVIEANATEARTTSNANSCTAFVSLTVTAEDCHDNEDLDWTYAIANNGANVATGTSNSINRDLAVGLYSITWTVSDPCGNADTLVQSLTVSDGVAPSLSCMNRAFDLGTTGSRNILASDFAGSSFDACTTAGDIEYHFGSVNGPVSTIFECDDLNGASSRDIALTIVAVDEAGNTSNCEVTLTLSASADVCNVDVTGQTAALTGEIATETNFTVDDVKVELTKANSAMSNTLTPIEGTFNFADIPMSDDYSISASREDDYLNGVTTLDLLLIQRHILGLGQLNSAYKVIAADVDGSDNVSGSDLIAIRKLILGTSIDFPIKRSWTFVDASQEFEFAYDPFPYSQNLTIASLEKDLAGLDFVGVKMGDVNENVFLESVALAGSRSISNLSVDVNTIEGGQMILSLSAEDKVTLAGLQTSLQINTDLVDIIAVTSDLIDLKDENYSISSDGEIRISWTTSEALELNEAADGLINVIVSPKASNMEVSDIITLRKGQINSEMYSYSGDEIEVANIGLIYNTTIDSELGFELVQNVPNPFVGNTMIRFYNPQASEVTLAIFDIAGKQLLTQKSFYNKGWNEINVESDQLEGAGLYIYEVNNGTEIARKKMMSID